MPGPPSRFSLEEKAAIIAEAKAVGFPVTAAKYGITPKTIYTWKRRLDQSKIQSQSPMTHHSQQPKKLKISGNLRFNVTMPCMTLLQCMQCCEILCESLPEYEGEVKGTEM